MVVASHRLRRTEEPNRNGSNGMHCSSNSGLQNSLVERKTNKLLHDTPHIAAGIFK
jgi:hypothetical protein